MTPTQPRAKERPRGSEECDALEAQFMHALITSSDNVEAASCDFRIEVKKIGSQFEVRFNGLYYPPEELAENEWHHHPLTQLAEEEHEHAEHACQQLGLFIGDEHGAFGLKHDHDYERFTGTKDQFVTALNGYFAKHGQPRISDPLLTSSKER